ncbi:MAG: GNAT family N-acetyltransferase [Cyanobacteria bacterium P01_A01_bin.84]
MNIPHIETERLILRGFREEDLDAYTEMCANEEVMRYVGTGETLSRSESWRSMAMVLGHWYLRGYGLWAVEERENGEMIGRIGCWKPEGWIDLEVGWTLRRSFWGRGYATEAGFASMKYAFEELGRERIISLIRPDNIASQRVAEKLGEKCQGSIEIASNEALIYVICREEWQKNHKN